MGKNRVTIKDLAQELNVSTSTVSRALQDNPALKDETKERVKALAKKWNYQPNTLALDLLRQSSKIIAVIVPEITSHFFSSTIVGIQDVMVSTEFNIMIFISNESYEEEALIKLSSSNNPHGCKTDYRGSAIINPKTQPAWYSALLAAYIGGKPVNLWLTTTCQEVWSGVSYPKVGHVYMQ